MKEIAQTDTKEKGTGVLQSEYICRHTLPQKLPERMQHYQFLFLFYYYYFFDRV